MQPTPFLLSSDHMMVLLIVMSALATGVVIVVTAILAQTLSARSDAALKHAMVAQGMSADDIARVIAARPGSAAAALPDSPPCASEAVVLDGAGAWLPALVLHAADGRYFVHYVGHGMDSNEWVEPDRIRFPAGPTPGRNGAPRKPTAEVEV